MSTQLLQYFMHDGPGSLRMELAGHLGDDDASRLERAWRAAVAGKQPRSRVIDMTFVTGSSPVGGALLKKLHKLGVQFEAHTNESRILTEGILGVSLPAAKARTF